MTILPNIGAIFTLAFGVAAAFMPQPVANALAWSLKGSRGSAEFRIGIGGVFMGLCGYAVYAQNDAIFTALGFMWLGAAIMRGVAILLDRPKLTATYIITWIVEIIIAGLLLI